MPSKVTRTVLRTEFYKVEDKQTGCQNKSWKLLRRETKGKWYENLNKEFQKVIRRDKSQYYNIHEDIKVRNSD